MMLEHLNGRQRQEGHPDTDLIAENDVVEISIDIEKIEPLGRYYSHDDIINKLHKVIENQNKIIDYLNGMVKK